MGRPLFGAAIVFLQAAALAFGAASAPAQTPRSISVAPSPAWRGKTLYSNSWAVVIGINRYQHPRIPELRYARKDAEDIRKTLPKLGFPESQILTLFDRQATKRAIERLLGDRMRRLVSPGDRVFVFFAGHGMDEEGEGYLIPYDADPENLYSTATSMRDLTLIAGRMRARHVLFAVDACYSGYAIYRTRKIVNPELVTDLTSRPAVQVIAAGRQGEVAQEREGNGLFTQVLLKGLEGAADRRGWGWLSLEHLGEYVRDRVYADSGKQQYPQFGNLSGDGQFVFVLPGEAPPRPDVGAGPRPGPSDAELARERAGLEEERRKLDVEKAGLERERLAAARKQLEEERKRIEEERKRIAARGAGVPPRPDVGAGPRPGPSPPRVAVGPGTPHEIGSGLDAMVLVPAGWFIMGSNDGGGGEKPQRRVYLDAFYIDKYPVTNARFRRFGKPQGDYGENFNGDKQPVVGVTWFQARDYCASVGKRLPTEAEWEKAVRGVDGRKYPWGNGWDETKLIWVRNGGGRTHAVDRSYNTHRSPFGAVDMAGNVWQWVADWYDANYYRAVPDRNPKGPASGQYRVLRGGSWLDDDQQNFRAAYRDWDFPDGRNYNLRSFRCAEASK